MHCEEPSLQDWIAYKMFSEQFAMLADVLSLKLWLELNNIQKSKQLILHTLNSLRYACVTFYAPCYFSSVRLMYHFTTFLCLLC